MSEITRILFAYMGVGFVLVLYVVCLLLLLKREKDQMIRLLLGWLPLVILILFFLPPFYYVYSKIDGADTYYRVLWLLPVSVTIAYEGISLLKERLLLATAVMILVAGMTGAYMYSTQNQVLQPAENRLHMPNAVLTVCDTITNDMTTEEVVAAMPSELVQFVRQYDTRIELAYGREMLMPQYSKYTSNAVYEEMERAEVISAKHLASACHAYSCDYVVLNASREVDGDLADWGYEILSNVDGYIVYRNTEAES